MIAVDIQHDRQQQQQQQQQQATTTSNNNNKQQQQQKQTNTFSLFFQSSFIFPHTISQITRAVSIGLFSCSRLESERVMAATLVGFNQYGEMWG